MPKIRNFQHRLQLYGVFFKFGVFTQQVLDNVYGIDCTLPKVSYTFKTIKSCTIRQQGNIPLMLAKNASCFKMVNSELNLNHEELFFQLLFPELQ